MSWITDLANIGFSSEQWKILRKIAETTAVEQRNFNCRGIQKGNISMENFYLFNVRIPSKRIAMAMVEDMEIKGYTFHGSQKTRDDGFLNGADQISINTKSRQWRWGNVDPLAEEHKWEWRGVNIGRFYELINLSSEVKMKLSGEMVVKIDKNRNSVTFQEYEHRNEHLELTINHVLDIINRIEYLRNIELHTHLGNIVDLRSIDFHKEALAVCSQTLTFDDLDKIKKELD